MFLPLKGAHIGMMNPGSSTVRDLARQLLDRERSDTAERADLGAAMQRACVDVSEKLRCTVGEDGYGALLARALARTEMERPILKTIRRDDTARIQLDVVTAVEEHGATIVRAGLEALLTALFEILGELIGMDMVRSLLGDDHFPDAT
jgi:hypothetical protein